MITPEQRLQLMQFLIDSDAFSDEEKSSYLGALWNTDILPAETRTEEEPEETEVDWHAILENLTPTLLSTITAKYKVDMREGKWRYSGYFTFFGSANSGRTRVSYWSTADSETGLNQSLDISAPRWQDFQNDYCRIARYCYIDKWENMGVVFGDYLKNGSGGNENYVVTVKKV